MSLWQTIASAGGGSALLVGAFGLGVLFERRRRHAPDRIYRIVVVDETDRSGVPGEDTERYDPPSDRR